MVFFCVPDSQNVSGAIPICFKNISFMYLEPTAYLGYAVSLAYKQIYLWNIMFSPKGPDKDVCDTGKSERST
jgi:hypothetical protein